MVFWIQSDVNLFDTVMFDAVDLASDCIQQLKQKLKLKHKQRLKITPAWKLCSREKNRNKISKYKTQYKTFIAVTQTDRSGHIELIHSLLGTGCPDIVPPRNTLIRRHGDTASVQCNRTQETWYVTCKGNAWIGEIVNCTQGMNIAEKRECPRVLKIYWTEFVFILMVLCHFFYIFYCSAKMAGHNIQKKIRYSPW